MKNSNRILYLVFSGLAVLTLTAGTLLASPELRKMFQSWGEARQAASKDRPDHVPNEYLVQFKTGVDISQQSHRYQSMDLESRLLPQDRMVKVRFKEGSGLTGAFASVALDPRVESMQPNYIYYKSEIRPDDQHFLQQWGLGNNGQVISPEVYSYNNPGTPGKDMNLSSAWQLEESRSCESIVVAVVDTGANYNHEDLVGNLWEPASGQCRVGTDDLPCPNHGWDFVNADNDPMDIDGHGTHVASIIGAQGNNSIGISGMCWDVQLMIVRVLGPSGGTTESIRDGITFANQNGAHIINLSLGNEIPYDTFMQSTIERATDEYGFRSILVAAAGNGGADGQGDDINGGENDGDGDPNTKVYPCSFGRVLCVTALDQNFEFPSFANYGQSSVELGAPGTNILGAWHGSSHFVHDELESGWTLTGEFGLDPDGGDGEWCIPETSSYLSLPSDFCQSSAGEYSPDTLSRASKGFTLSGASHIVRLQFYAILDLTGSSDYFRVYYDSDSTPFDGDLILELSDLHEFRHFDIDLPHCAVMTECSVGFEFDADEYDSDYEYGVAIPGGTSIFGLYEAELLNNQYRVLNGTSMATPHISGLLALIWSVHPDFRAEDVVNALTVGGTPIPDGDLFIKHPRVPDAKESLKHIPDQDFLRVEPE